MYIDVINVSNNILKNVKNVTIFLLAFGDKSLTLTEW